LDIFHCEDCCIVSFAYTFFPERIPNHWRRFSEIHIPRYASTISHQVMGGLYIRLRNVTIVG
jgi:hypothetical protein